MSSAIELSPGTKLEVEGTPSSGTFTEIADCFKLSGPKQKRKFIPVTALNDGNVDIKKPTRIDPGNYTATVGFTKTQYSTIRGYFTDGILRKYRMTTPGSSTEVFYAYVASAPLEVPEEEKITYELELEVTGPTAPVFTS